MNLKDLTKEIEYKLRVWPWWKELAYIDARQAQDLLDEVCWPENWKVEYKEISWNLFAWVSIKVWDEWITKWDAWSESNIEKEKWHISDSFKRACVTWGIWRFLYNIKPAKGWTVRKVEKKTFEDNPNKPWIWDKEMDLIQSKIAEYRLKYTTDQDFIKWCRDKFKVSKANAKTLIKIYNGTI